MLIFLLESRNTEKHVKRLGLTKFLNFALTPEQNSKESADFSKQCEGIASRPPSNNNNLHKLTSTHPEIISKDF